MTSDDDIYTEHTANFPPITFLLHHLAQIFSDRKLWQTAAI